MPCSLSEIQAAACTSGIGKEQSRIKLLQLIAQLTCEAAEGGGPTEVAWGDITGTLSNQTDLQAALDQRARLLTYASNTNIVATGSVGTIPLWTVNIPAGAMGPNGFIRCTYIATANNDASVKQLGAYLNNTLFFTASLTNTATIFGYAAIHNQNAQNAQRTRPALDNTTVNSATTVAPFTIAVDTSVAFDFKLQAVLADATDNVTLRDAFLEVFYVA